MRIVNVGYDYRHPNYFSINRPNGSGDYILLVVKTAAFFVFRGERLIASPDSVVVLKKGTPQLYGALDGEYINDWIHFELEEEEIPEIEKLGIPFDTILPVSDITVFSSLIKSMFSEKYSQNAYKDRSLQLYFQLILLKLSERIDASDVKRENLYYTEFSALRNEIYSRPERDWNIDEISIKMNLSRSYIQHLYKAFFEKSIIADVTDSRMEYAKYLLSATDIAVNVISQMCGYNNDVHFMRVFKRITGLTPTQFRKNIHVAQSEIVNARSENPFCL